MNPITPGQLVLVKINSDEPAWIIVDHQLPNGHYSGTDFSSPDTFDVTFLFTKDDIIRLFLDI